MEINTFLGPDSDEEPKPIAARIRAGGKGWVDFVGGKSRIYGNLTVFEDGKVAVRNDEVFVEIPKKPVQSSLVDDTTT